VRRPARRLLDRVRGEFTEMQGFSPTLDQAARLFSLSRDECHRVFSQLLREGFLGCSPDGRYRLNPPRP
jgi:DNA-binding IclR family transcriptional regulator